MNKNHTANLIFCNAVMLQTDPESTHGMQASKTDQCEC